MSDLIQFARNYQDKSTDRGYQFEFRCDKFCTECGQQIEAGKKFCAKCGAKS